MSGFSLWDADDDTQNAPQRQARLAANKLATAIDTVRASYGPFLLGSTGKDEFEDRWHYSKADIRRTAEELGVFPNTGTMRRIHDALKRDFKATIGDDNSDDPAKPPKGGKDEPTTINNRQKKSIEKGEPGHTEDVDTNTGDGSDSDGDNPSSTTGPQGDPRKTGPERKKSNRKTAEDFDGDLVPEDNWEGYLDSVDAGGPEKVQRNFTDGDDSGVDKSAKRLFVDLYQDWARSNGMRVASTRTLEAYALGGIDNRDYDRLAALIKRAGDDCDCDDDEGSDGPPPPPSSGEESHDGPDDSDSGDDSEGDSSGDSGDDSESESSEGPPADSDGSDSGSSDSESDSGGDESAGENPFGDDSGSAPADDSADAGDDSGFEGPPEGPDLNGEEAGVDPAADPGGQYPDAAGPGDQFAIPDAPPQLAPEEQGMIPQDDTSGEAAIPPEVIDDILGLPPGTVEQLVMEELAQAGAGPQGPPQQMAARRRKRAAEDESGGGGSDPSSGDSPAGGGQAVAPAEPAPAPPASPSQPGADNGALLDQAGTAMTQLVEQKTQEYQTIIDPLQQALQAIQFAQSVEQAANPMDVTPPEGTVNVNPDQAPAAQAAPEQAPPAPAAAPAAAPAPMAAPAAQQLQPVAARRVAARIAAAYDISEKGENLILEAMSRRDYQHVAEAIATQLPPEHRLGVAHSIADLFGSTNVRFNRDAWLNTAGVAPTQTVASRRPFVVRSRLKGGGRAPQQREATEQGWRNSGDLDAFEFPGKAKKPGAAEDNNPLTPDMDVLGKGGPKIGGITDQFTKWDQKRTDKGLNMGDDADVDSFITTHKGIGDRAQTKLHQNMGLQPHEVGKPPATPKIGFFQPRVEGYRWDDHLAAYVANERKPFRCTTAGCDTEISPPGHTTCASCGRLWNAYAIGDGQHLASDQADMYLVREIPIRDNVIMANRHFAERENEAEDNVNSDGPFQDYPEDVEFYSDDELENAPAPHAPGETDMDTRKSAAAIEDSGYLRDLKKNPVTPDAEDEYWRGKIDSEHDAANPHDHPGEDWLDQQGEHYNRGYGRTPNWNPETDPFDPRQGWSSDWTAARHAAVRHRAHRSAASYGDDDHNVTYRDGERFCSACDAMLWDPNVHHCPSKQAAIEKLDSPNDAWKTHDETSNKGYEQGPDSPPSLSVNSPTSDWAKRGPEKGPAGQWAKPTFAK